MCTVLSVDNAADKLASLMLKEMGVQIDAKMLSLFIRANWRLVSAYAHAIHGSDEPKPAYVQDLPQPIMGTTKNWEY